MRAMEKRPDARFTTACEMREAIERATGLRLGDMDAGPELSSPAHFARAELMCDAWPAPIQIVATPIVIIGTAETAHIRVRRYGSRAEVLGVDEAIVTEHARIDWCGGVAQHPTPLTDAARVSGFRVCFPTGQ